MITFPHAPPATLGRVLHWAAGYDLLVWFFTRRSDRAFREQLAGLAHLVAGDSVLDIGCGTGTLARVAKRQVGATGMVFGIDASPAMIARATLKASKAGIDVSFKNAVAEALPFPDAQFDVVLSTLMLHHLPRTLRQQCVGEVRRVLKPGGRVLVVDFGVPQRKSGFLAHVHRHGHVNPKEIVTLLDKAGLRRVESGPVGISSLHFVLAVASSDRAHISRPHLDRHPRNSRSDRGARRSLRVCVPRPPICGARRGHARTCRLEGHVVETLALNCSLSWGRYRR